ncbi:MAG: hypothetical protein ACE5GS_16020 [Kiloniellaceae bacterium]
MGEIVDLDSYRKRRKRKAAESRSAGSRRHTERYQSRHDRTGTAVESLEAGRAEPDERGKIERDDQTAD